MILRFFDRFFSGLIHFFLNNFQASMGQNGRTPIDPSLLLLKNFMGPNLKGREIRFFRYLLCHYF